MFLWLGENMADEKDYNYYSHINYTNNLNKMKDLPTGQDFQWRAMIPNNVGWIELRLSKDIMNYLWKQIESASTDFRSQLAGNIKQSQVIEDKDEFFFRKVLSQAIIHFEDQFGEYNKAIVDNTEDEYYKYCMNAFWVNHQYEGQFNPPHAHGAVYSFVIWMKIPTDFKEQHKLYLSKGTGKPKSSNFEFNYPNIVGQMTQHTYLMNEDVEGMMLFFPSSLQHQVYPFYGTKEPRISISGNIRLKNTKSPQRTVMMSENKKYVG